MKSDHVERTLQTSLHALADTLLIDAPADWRKVLDRKRRLALRDGEAITSQRFRHRLTGRRQVVTVLIAATVVAAGVASLLTFDSGPASGTPTLPEPLAFAHGGRDAAIALLDRAALQQGATAGSGPVQYAQTQNYALQIDVAQRSASTTVETTLREVWVGSDGTSIAKSARQDTTRAGEPVGPPSDQSTDNHWHDTNVGLPSSVDAIETALLGPDQTDGERNLILAQQVMAHLGQGTTTPVQTAILYQLLASLPGVFDAGTVIDNAGRTGHAVGVPTGYFDSGKRCVPVSGDPATVNAILAAHNALGEGITYLVLDPSTGEPLEVEAVDTPNAPCALGLPAQPTIQQYNVILKSGRVAMTGASSTH